MSGHRSVGVAFALELTIKLLRTSSITWAPVNVCGVLAFIVAVANVVYRPSYQTTSVHCLQQRRGVKRLAGGGAERLNFTTDSCKVPTDEIYGCSKFRHFAPKLPLTGRTSSLKLRIFERLISDKKIFHRVKFRREGLPHLHQIY